MSRISRFAVKPRAKRTPIGNFRRCPPIWSSSTSTWRLDRDQLSERELQVFTMIGKGRTTHSIAAELHLAVSTVETYRERLKTKLNLESGAELTRRAILWVIQHS